jgi:hypothetical protein
MSIHYSLNHRIKNLSSNSSFLAKLSSGTRMIWTSVESSGQNFLRKSGWSGPVSDHPAWAPRPFWSSLDDPALPRIIRPWQSPYIKGRRQGCPNFYSFLPAAPTLLLKSSCGDFKFGPRICWALLCLWFSTSRKIRPLRNSFDSRGKSQRYLIQNPHTPIS